MRAGSGGYDPTTGVVTRPFKGISYWIKGYFSGGVLQVGMNVWHTLYALGALALAGLGMYAAIEGEQRRMPLIPECVITDVYA